MEKAGAVGSGFFMNSGRGERIRTSGLYVPNVALYQAKLHPEKMRRRLSREAAITVNPAQLNATDPQPVWPRLRAHCVHRWLATLPAMQSHVRLLAWRPAVHIPKHRFAALLSVFH